MGGRIFTAQYGPQTVPAGTPKMAFWLGWDSVTDEAYENWASA